MALPQEKIYTIDDIYNLPEGTRGELIDGQIYYMATPSRIHQEISGYLFNEIYNHIKANKGTCKVYSAPFAVFLNRDDKTYIEPDISVVCDSNKLDEKGCNGAPDWVIEITSPSSASRDYITKLNKYKNAGVKEYWIINPQTSAIYVYYFEVNELKAYSYTFKDKVKVNIYDDLIIDFSELKI